MDYPVLSKGQKIIVNTGYNIIPAIVESVEGSLVSPVGHKDFLRCDCYADPEEMERLISDVRNYAADVERIARGRVK